MSSAGLDMSEIFEIVIAHLKVGAQKNIVKGPAGCDKKEAMGVGQGSFSTAA